MEQRFLIIPGWLIKIKVTDPGELDELMNEKEYDKYVGDDKED